MLVGTAVPMISLVDITLFKTVVPTTLAGIVVPANWSKFCLGVGKTNKEG